MIDRLHDASIVVAQSPRDRTAGHRLRDHPKRCFLYADGSHLVPSDPFARAQVLQWLFFEQYSHEPNIAVVIFWVAYATDPPPQAEIEARRALGHVALEAIERHLSSRSFLVAERFTIADIALYAYTHRAERGGFDLHRYPAIGRWLQRIVAQEGHVPMDAPQPK